MALKSEKYPETSSNNEPETVAQVHARRLVEEKQMN